KQLADKQPLFTLLLSDSRVEPAETLQQQLCADISNKQFYLCGPQTFMQQLRNTLSRHGVPAEHITHEQFGLALPAATTDLSSTNNLLLSANFIRAGINTTVTLNSQHSLLQSAEQHNLAPRFGCRMGVCFQCVCDKVSGQVRDLRSGALSGHGAEQIQLCVSQPVTELVIKL